MHKLAKILFSFLEKVTGKKLVYIPKDRDLQNKTAVKTEEGFWYVGDVSDTHDLAYGILHNGVLEKSETKLVKSILLKWLESKAAINFYDVGANTGYYGVLAAFLGQGKIKVNSFEPLLEFCEAIKESSQVNGLENLILVNNFALGSKNEDAEISLAGTGSSLNPNFLGTANKQKRKVSVKKLDDYVNGQKNLAPDFVKIDVEGFELEVLKGAEETIKTYKPVLYVEVAKSLSNLGRDFVNGDFEKVFKFLEKFAYKPFLFNGQKLVPVEKSFNQAGVHMFLFLPENAQEITKIF